MIPNAVVFDLDNTLAVSKAPIDTEMALLLGKLLMKTPVAIISGGKLEQLVTQAADLLPEETDRTNLYLLPTSGAALFSFKSGLWQPVYEEKLSDEEAARISSALEEAARSTGTIDLEAPSYGPRIEFRGAQVSLSALGQEAPVALKEAWDPSREKRRAFVAAATPLLPEYDVKSGGLTTIDVTRKGVNKAFGIRQLAAHLSLSIPDMLYVGDAVYPGGNDEAALETGIPVRKVANPEETKQAISEILGG